VDLSEPFGELEMPDPEDIDTRQTYQEFTNNLQDLAKSSGKKKKFSIANIKKARDKIKLKVIKASKNKNVAITVIGQEGLLNP
jgi:hypothetical protein